VEIACWECRKLYVDMCINFVFNMFVCILYVICMFFAYFMYLLILAGGYVLWWTFRFCVDCICIQNMCKYLCGSGYTMKIYCAMFGGPRWQNTGNLLVLTVCLSYTCTIFLTLFFSILCMYEWMYIVCNNVSTAKCNEICRTSICKLSSSRSQLPYPIYKQTLYIQFLAENAFQLKCPAALPKS